MLHIIYSGFSPIHLFPWKKKNNLSEQENYAKMNKAGSPAALKLDESESRQFVWKEIIIENNKIPCWYLNI